MQMHVITIKTHLNPQLYADLRLDLPDLAPDTRQGQKPGAAIRAPGSAGAGAAHPHECNYGIPSRWKLQRNLGGAPEMRGAFGAGGWCGFRIRISGLEVCAQSAD